LSTSPKITSNPTFPNFPKNIPTIDLKSQFAEPMIDIPAIDRIQVLSPDEIFEVSSTTENPAISIGGKISKALHFGPIFKNKCPNISHSKSKS
jgi:hypothetical protein